LTSIIAAFVAKLKSSLMMNDESVSETTPVIDLGVDSLVAVEIRTWFAQEVGADVAVLKILGGPSIEELVEDVLSNIGASLSASLQVDNNATPSFESDAEASSTTSPDGEAASSSSRTSVESDDEEQKKE
jgi:acyl carrier protein